MSGASITHRLQIESVITQDESPPPIKFEIVPVGQLLTPPARRLSLFIQIGARYSLVSEDDVVVLRDWLSARLEDLDRERSS